MLKVNPSRAAAVKLANALNIEKKFETRRITRRDPEPKRESIEWMKIGVGLEIEFTGGSKDEKTEQLRAWLAA